MSIKREEQLKLDVLQLQQDLGQAKEALNKLEVDYRVVSEQKAMLERLSSERESTRSSSRLSAESDYMKYEIK